MDADRFVKELSSISFDNTFNPYSERCNVYDYFDAPRQRKTLLKEMLRAASSVQIDSVWIGRDLGYRGGRRTGLALTDDVHLTSHTRRWGVEVGRLTKGEAVPERTAAVIWSALSQISSPIFLWNVFPLHPYEAGAPFSNRVHNSKERKAGEEVLDMLLNILKPKRIIAVGNDAESTAYKLRSNSEIVKVRHPSYGGQNIFLAQIKSLYGIDALQGETVSLF